MKPKTKLTVVIPSFNDADYLLECLGSLAQNTFYPFEVIIINNGSDKIQKTKIPWELINTKELFKALRLPDYNTLRIINLKKNEWVNYAWDLGAKKATGEYVVEANSDITFSKNWDKYLIEALEGSERLIACPLETNPQTSVPFALPYFMMKDFPNMIKGPCFMFRKSDYKKLFPIPSEIKHWCGDNVIADRAEALGGVVFVKKAIIFHHITVSGRRMKPSKYQRRIMKDVIAYEKLSGRDMSKIKKSISV